MGKVVGADGKDGVNGTNGKDGINGTDGVDGKDGADGEDGVGITKAEIVNGELILYFSNNTSINLGNIKVVDGKDGINGTDGKDQRELDNNQNSPDYGKWIDRNEDDCESEIKYFLDYLSKCEYIQYNDGPSKEEWAELSLMPKGYARVDELQKTRHMVAMFLLL